MLPKLLKYSSWMALNSCAESCSAVISTNSMLSSIMTAPSYTAVIATTYVGKDIIGQLGGMVYAWKTGKKADKDALAYITKGALLLHTGFYLENISCLVKPDFTLPVLGLSSVVKNIAFISIGAVSASNIQKMASQNMGETYSKIASINTLSSTIGMLLGIGIIHTVPSYTVRSVLILPILTGISLYAVRKATQLCNQV
jgi:hypothetical protein